MQYMYCDNNIKWEAPSPFSFPKWHGFSKLLSVDASEIFTAWKSIIYSADDYRIFLRDKFEMKKVQRICTEKKTGKILTPRGNPLF